MNKNDPERNYCLAPKEEWDDNDFSQNSRSPSEEKPNESTFESPEVEEAAVFKTEKTLGAPETVAALAAVAAPEVEKVSTLEADAPAPEEAKEVGSNKTVERRRYGRHYQ